MPTNPQPPSSLLQNLKSRNRDWARRSDYHIGDAIRTRWLWRELIPLMEQGAHRVFDAGCGAAQHTLELAARYPQVEIVGVDNRPEPVMQAQRQADDRGLTNVRFGVADLTKPVDFGTFDVIYSVDVIEHIEQDQTMLDVLAAALNPGGHLLIHTPLTPQKHFFRRFDLEQNVNELHVREGYERGELEAKAQNAGLGALQTLYTHGDSGTFAWEIWRLVRPWAPLKIVAKPFLMGLVNLETRRMHDYGNCILLVAQKPMQ